jgi:hypothetical protein
VDQELNLLWDKFWIIELHLLLDGGSKVESLWRADMVLLWVPLILQEKVYVTPQTIKGGLLHLSNYKTGFSTPKLSKTSQITPERFWKVILLQWQWFCLFLFLFIFAESLKNHNKSQKNHKIENLILLDSTWVDLHSELITWYALVQSFCCSFISMFFCN